MNPEFVNVPVPSDRVIEVYEFLSRPRTASGSLVVDAVVAKPLPWSEELLRRAYEESPEAMKVVFETLADRPGSTVTMEELAKVLGLKRAQMAGVLGAFGRRWRNRYRQAEASWPFKAYWSTEAGMMVYSMTEPVAAVFVAVRNG